MLKKTKADNILESTGSFCIYVLLKSFLPESWYWDRSPETAVEHNVNWDLNISILPSSSFFLDNPKEYVLHGQTQTHFHYYWLSR